MRQHDSELDSLQRMAMKIIQPEFVLKQYEKKKIFTDPLPWVRGSFLSQHSETQVVYK